jgi:hypothetical protein
MSVISLIPV